MAIGPYKITEDFEQAISDYTGAPYVAVVDSCSHAIFLSLFYEIRYGKLKDNFAPVASISIPKRTFPSVPCEIIHCGLRPTFTSEDFNGIYQLFPSKVWDSALRFTYDMYKPDTHMCISFTGPRKRLKLGKGGAILTNDNDAYEWFKQARMSGRHEMPFIEDKIEFPGWNYYLLPEIAARGLQLIREFYDDGGYPIPQSDIALDYPDLSKMPAFAFDD